MFDAAAPESWFERLRGNQPTGLANFSPKTVRAAACQQIVRIGGDIHLAELPLLQASPATDVSVIPSSPVLTTEPDSHQPTLARFDLHRLDDGRLAVGWAAHDEHARLWMAYRQRNQKMPLAVIIGGDPAFLLAASAPLPPGSDVCAVAGLLREKSLDVVACRSVDLEVPAEAEIVLEGFVDPAEPLVSAGPFCGPMGSLTHPWRAPVMHVTAVTHRANPLFVAMKPGRPPNEAVTVARAMHRVFRPLARLAIPELVDYNLPEFGAARYWAAVSIQKTYPGQGRRAALAAWNLPAMLFAKMLVVVDDDVDVHDHARVLAAMTEHVRPDRDVWTEKGPADPFDPTVPPGSLSVKMAFDATRKMGAE
jgi:4-hydroxy-3-polyprenylbenzoate decarboxylase